MIFIIYKHVLSGKLYGEKSHVPKSSSLIPWLLSSTNSAYFSFIFLPLTSLHPFQIVWSSVKFLEVDIILYKSNIFFYVYMGFSNIIRHESPISRLYIKLNKIWHYKIHTRFQRKTCRVSFRTKFCFTIYALYFRLKRV